MDLMFKGSSRPTKFSFIQHQLDETSNESRIVVIGSVAENVSAAKKDILEDLERISLDVEKNLVGKMRRFESTVTARDLIIS